jgi:uncharacterized FAD-dependent dehydrogenase
VILATGHSARDIYHLLHRQGIRIEAKGFAMGVRAEHPQALIDSIQYHCRERNPYLPAASYGLVHQVDGRGVYSFCMCPGGHIVPSATEEKQIVVNGMSASHRNSPFANSGIVVDFALKTLRNMLNMANCADFVSKKTSNDWRLTITEVDYKLLLHNVWPTLLKENYQIVCLIAHTCQV